MVTAPPASSMLARVVSVVVAGRDDVKFLGLNHSQVAMELGKKTTLFLVNWDEARSDDLAQHLKRVMKQKAKGTLVVGFVGGTDHARSVLKKAKPIMTGVKVGQVHINDRGEVWSRDAGPVKQALSNLQRTSPPSESEWARFLEKSAADVAELKGEAQKARNFQAVLGSRRPVVTWTLAGIILAVFGLEFAFGGTQSAPVLLRMGALSPERVWAGEVWRLFSCTFLHSGVMHVAFNTFVLIVLGTSLERVLGTGRFVVLYFLSCLGGSLVSLTFLEGFSVGASGGLWGLLGAEAVLAWRSQGLLPKYMIQGARRAATFNLGINVLNSFRPHVDMWAHFGGGAVGAALLLTGALTRGLPRLGELADDGHLESADDVEIPSGPLLESVARVLAVVFLVGLGLGLGTGQPWTLSRPFEQVRTDLPSLGLSLSLPKGLGLASSSPGEAMGVTVGDLISDPGAVSVTVYPGDFTDAAVLAKEREDLGELLKKTPPGASLAAGPENMTIAGLPGVTVRYRFDNDTEEELAFVFLTNALIKADSLRWPAFGDAVPQGYAAQVLDSLQPLDPDTVDRLPPRFAAIIEALTPQAIAGDPEAQNELAWLLATCEDPAYLNGQEAVKYARMAVAQTPDDAAIMDTLAAAYARAGNFRDAVETQERALELLSDESSRQSFQDRLELYESGQAYTEP